MMKRFLMVLALCSVSSAGLAAGLNDMVIAAASTPIAVDYSNTEDSGRWEQDKFAFPRKPVRLRVEWHIGKEPSVRVHAPL